MPAPGSQLRYGGRNYIFNVEFWKQKLVKDKKIDISYRDAKRIIEASNKNIAACITDELDGFKLPFGFGYIVACKYVAKNPAINWPETHKLGKYVYHTNLHTLGYSVKLNWFRVGRITNNNFHEVFKFITYKTLKKSVSDMFGSGKKPYAEWSIPDFVEKSRVEKLYSKKYRKEELKQI